METQRITSRQNPLIRRAASLAREADRRREENAFLCEGARLCRDAALSGLTVEACFFTSQAALRYPEYLEPVRRAARESYEIGDHVAALLSDTRTTQGIFCLCGRPEGLREEGSVSPPRKNCLVLENLQDPGNLGTILRTAEALGTDRVYLLGDCCDPLSPKVLRASMGAVFRLSLIPERSPAGLKERLEGYGFRLHAAVPDSTAVKVTEIDFTRGLHAVLIGNEGNGLTGETVALCHDRVTIPMNGRAESLNASAAATILLWEVCRGEKGETGHG